MANPKGNRYVYVWKENGIANSGLPFYVGIGTHRSSDVPTQKYYRAYQRHLTTGKKNTFAQNKADSLNGNYVTEILYDDLTKERAMELEILLIKRLGRRINSTGILCNITKGGTFSPLDTPWIREKHLKVMREGNYNKTPGKETIYENIIYKSQKELYKSFGMTKSTYKKMTSLGISLNTYKPLKKKLEYNGIVYDSIKELATYLNIDRHCISKIANGLKENEKIGDIKWLEK